MKVQKFRFDTKNYQMDKLRNQVSRIRGQKKSQFTTISESYTVLNIKSKRL